MSSPATVCRVIERTIDAFGARWRLALDLGPGPAAELAALWERAGVTDPADAAPVDAPAFVVGPAVPLEEHGVVVTEVGSGTAYDISRAVTLASIERRAGDALMLHAAALCDTDGATLALVAASGTGKTTAAAVLGRHLGYVTDETVAVDARAPGLVVRAYPKPLSVIRDPARPDDKSEHSPAELGLLPAAPRLHLACLLLLERSAGPRAATLEEVPLLDALAQLIPQTSSLLMLDRPLQRLAEVVTLAGPPRALRYSEVADCLPLVTAALREPVPAPPWVGEAGDVPAQERFAQPPPSAPPQHLEVTGDTLLVRTPWRDAVHVDGETLLIADELPVRLSALGALVWRECRQPRRVADLVDVARAELGDHPDAARLVGEAAQAMATSGLLRSGSRGHA